MTFIFREVYLIGNARQVHIKPVILLNNELHGREYVYFLCSQKKKIRIIVMLEVVM